MYILVSRKIGLIAWRLGFSVRDYMIWPHATCNVLRGIDVYNAHVES